MSVPITDRINNYSKYFKSIDNTHSMKRTTRAQNKHLIMNLNPIPRMKTVRIITKPKKLIRIPQLKYTINSQRPFKSPEKKTSTNSKPSLNFLDEISPILPGNFIFPTNRLDESKVSQDDTLTIIVDDLKPERLK